MVNPTSDEKQSSCHCGRYGANGRIIHHFNSLYISRWKGERSGRLTECQRRPADIDILSIVFR